jgi:hypothetical protein
VSADLTLKQGDLQPEARVLLTDDAGAAIDLSSAVSVDIRMINFSDEELVLDAPATIETPATAGQVSYAWQTGDTDTPGVYRVSWVVTWTNGDQTFPAEGYLTIEIEGASVLEAWATANDVFKVAGIETDDGTVIRAQFLMETHINRIWRATDATGRDHVWLRRAVAYQAGYMAENPDLFTGLAGVKMVKQGDNQIQYGDAVSGDEELLIAPLARLAVARLSRAYGTVKLNSAYRGFDRRLPPWRSTW